MSVQRHAQDQYYDDTMAIPSSDSFHGGPDEFYSASQKKWYRRLQADEVVDPQTQQWISTGTEPERSFNPYAAESDKLYKRCGDILRDYQHRLTTQDHMLFYREIASPFQSTEISSTSVINGLIHGRSDEVYSTKQNQWYRILTSDEIICASHCQWNVMDQEILCEHDNVRYWAPYNVTSTIGKSVAAAAVYDLNRNLTARFFEPIDGPFLPRAVVHPQQPAAVAVITPISRNTEATSGPPMLVYGAAALVAALVARKFISVTAARPVVVVPIPERKKQPV